MPTFLLQYCTTYTICLNIRISLNFFSGSVLLIDKWPLNAHRVTDKASSWSAATMSAAALGKTEHFDLGIDWALRLRPWGSLSAATLRQTECCDPRADWALGPWGRLSAAILGQTDRCDSEANWVLRTWGRLSAATLEQTERWNPGQTVRCDPGQTERCVTVADWALWPWADWALRPWADWALRHCGRLSAANPRQTECYWTTTSIDLAKGQWYRRSWSHTI